MAEHEHGMTKKKYWTIFAWLMILLFLTVFVAYMHINSTLAIIIAMTIAVVKATLVVLYFMHVRFNSKLTWVFVVSGFVWLLIMVGITMTDYETRSWEHGGYGTVEQTYSSPFNIPAQMYPQNMAPAEGHGEGGEQGAEAGHGHTEEGASKKEPGH